MELGRSVVTPSRRIVLVDDTGLHRIMTYHYGESFAETLLGGAVVLSRITPRALYYTPNPALAPGLQTKDSDA